jgi:acetyltransferase-like isoleucine patch superfamily enzyme
VSLCNDAWPRVSKEHFDIAKMISGEFVTTVICDGASLGANVVVLPGVTIGERAMIGAGSIVTRNVPQDCLYRRDGTWVQINDETISMQKRMRAAY